MNAPFDVSRREFFQVTAAVAAAPQPQPAGELQNEPIFDARWIWYPERRTLPSTFVFFRKTLDLGALPATASAWVTGNSRYMLFLNGRFLQRGPAPCDPRYWDVDPVDLGSHLRAGRNVIGAIVCSFGGGDGTYVPTTPVGSGANPGFLFQADLGAEKLRSDTSWKTLRAACWPAGNYQRWFLRALQEEFDARLYPHGWLDDGFDDSAWRAAEFRGRKPGAPLIAEVAPANWPPDWKLVPRAIPLLTEKREPATKLGQTGWVHWKVAPEEYFDNFVTGAFSEEPSSAVAYPSPDALFPVRVAAPGRRSAVVTFEFDEELCGHIYVRLKAKAGTAVEMLYAEAPDPRKLLIRATPAFGQWVRLIARDGETEFESFDYDALRSLQLAIRNTDEPVEILEAGVRRRTYPYPHQPDVRTSDASINRAISGAIATHNITSTDTIVDNVTRERQQYAGDLDHTKLTSYYGFGEFRQPARMLRTFSQGQSEEGWFMDCWPAWDRCQRLWQKHLKLTGWGPLLDHAMQLVIATADYYLFSGDKSVVDELWPRYLKFERFLAEHAGRDSLLPVSGWTWNSVWLDHQGWKDPVDKTAAFNIYYAGFLNEGIARLADFIGDRQRAAVARARAARVVEHVRSIFWSSEHRLVVDNLPRVARDGELRLHDRTSAIALLYGVVPAGQEGPTIDVLAGIPIRAFGPIFHFDKPKAEVGFSYPLNACWRLWALSRYGRGDVVVRELRERWGGLKSLLLNNTFAENWEPNYTETGNIWCQNGPVVLYTLYGEVLGVKPVAPGFAEFDVRPQIGDLAWIEGTVHSPRGPIHVRCGQHELSLTVPAGVRAGVVLAVDAAPKGPPDGVSPIAGPAPGTRRWLLPVEPAAHTWKLQLA